MKKLGLLILTFFPWYLSAMEAREGFVEGVDYFRLQPNSLNLSTANSQEIANKTSIRSFFWYGCESCFQVDSHLQLWLELQSKNIEISHIPAMLNSRWTADARLFALLNELQPAQVTELHSQIYILKHKQELLIGDRASETEWFKSLGIDEKAIDSAYSGEGSWKALQSYQIANSNYQITTVPTIIINDQFAITAQSATSANRLIEIIEFLLIQANDTDDASGTESP